MSVLSICGIIICSDNPESLSQFYQKALGFKFEREQHGELLTHFGVDIGQIHFGIHPPQNMQQAKVGNASTSIAFNVDSLAEVMKKLHGLGAKLVTEPHDEGFGMVASFLDPDGNLFELVELNYQFTENK